MDLLNSHPSVHRGDDPSIRVSGPLLNWHNDLLLRTFYMTSARIKLTVSCHSWISFPTAPPQLLLSACASRAKWLKSQSLAWSATVCRRSRPPSSPVTQQYGSLSELHHKNKDQSLSAPSFTADFAMALGWKRFSKDHSRRGRSKRVAVK